MPIYVFKCKICGQIVNSNRTMADSDKECVCECGNITIVASNHLRSGHTTSCGCLWRERIYKGGKSKTRYCKKWTKNFRESIKKRDGYKCMNPYCDSKDPYDLTVHHIDYNGKNCKKKNLITACRGCNSGANGNKEWHQAWYQAIMHMRYGYVYVVGE